MNALGVLLAAASVGAADPAPSYSMESRRAVAALAGSFLSQGKPQTAIETIGPVIAAFDTEAKRHKGPVYCSMSGSQAAVYLARPETKQMNAVAIPSLFCDALFIKGYALFDLGKIGEAQSIYIRLTVLAPLHSHFFIELAQTFRLQRNWKEMYSTCQFATNLIDLAPTSKIVSQRIFAWRCMGYALMEQGRFDEAEAAYRKCLKLRPNDAGTLNELRYLAEQRRKQA